MKKITVFCAAILLALASEASAEFSKDTWSATGNSSRAPSTGDPCEWYYTDPCDGNGYCYHLIELKQNFYAAETQCAMTYQYGHLATPSTPAENNFLKWKLAVYYGRHDPYICNSSPDAEFNQLWIGAYKQNDVWRWVQNANPSDQSFSNYQDWFLGQPDHEEDACGYMIGQRDSGAYFQWADMPCATELYFVCERRYVG